MSFAGRTVVVTGAGSGIGLRVVTRLLEAGATVYAGDLDPSRCPDEAVKAVLDVRDESSVAAVIDRAVSDTGRLDVLCNNAGIASTADPISCTAEEWDRVFAVNTRGVFLGTRHALPHMLAQGHGAIVNTASVAGQIGLKNRAAYCASKGAVIAFSRQVAVQYAGDGIRCNCVCPGTVDSPWVGRLVSASADPQAARAELIARQPLGRLARPDEIATAIVYLAGDDAQFITGSELVIDGGILAG